MLRIVVTETVGPKAKHSYHLTLYKSAGYLLDENNRIFHQGCSLKILGSLPGPTAGLHFIVLLQIIVMWLVLAKELS
jgi:hypothetical protein